MASMSGARRALQGLRSSSRSFSLGGGAGAGRSSHSSSSTFSRVSRPMPPTPFSRLPVELGCAQSLVPLHSATASALLTSMLSQKPGTWAWLSEGLDYLNFKMQLSLMQRDLFSQLKVHGHCICKERLVSDVKKQGLEVAEMRGLQGLLMQGY